MRSATGLAYLVGRAAAMSGPWALLVALAAAIAAGLLVGDQLLAPDPELTAPLRWRASAWV
jgi:hypothetical protein